MVIKKRGRKVRAYRFVTKTRPGFVLKRWKLIAGKKNIFWEHFKSTSKSRSTSREGMWGSFDPSKGEIFANFPLFFYFRKVKLFTKLPKKQ